MSGTKVVATGAAEEGNTEAVAMVQGTYAWEPVHEPNLIDVSFSLPKGALCMVVGAVGSGKSSLLAALLGEMPCVRGTAVLRGSVALSTQDAWIQNASVRNNVLMGAALDKARYDAVLHACALEADLLALPAGDATEIGEKGVTLSGAHTPVVAVMLACITSHAYVFASDCPAALCDRTDRFQWVSMHAVHAKNKV